jgi:glyoxylase-like metal-dependent hydrolase (beta-lactamase superfamily II)
MRYYKIEQVHPWLYTIYDPLEVYCYLIVGEKRALLYDTGHGVARLDDAIREVCDLPYDVVLSHGHWDHTAGAYQFDEVWLHPGDEQLCRRHFAESTRQLIADMYEAMTADNKTDYKFDRDDYVSITDKEVLKPLEHGQIFDLGGITCEIIPMQGHTAGSVGALIREHKQLLVGDATNSSCWMFLEDCLHMSVYIEMLKHLQSFDFELFTMSHSAIWYPKSDIEKYIHVAENIDLDRSSPYDYKFDVLGGYSYAEGDVSIVFDPRRV